MSEEDGIVFPVIRLPSACSFLVINIDIDIYVCTDAYVCTCIDVCIFEISPPLLRLFGRGGKAENSLYTKSQ